MLNQFIHTNGIRLHYLDSATSGPPLVLLPGLTANANCFDALAAGLRERFRVLALDLRGRGLSDQPASGYRLADHAADVFGLLDALGLPRVILAGHSFGALLALHMAARFPKRFSQIILLDIGLGVANPQTYALLKPSIDRLGRQYASWPAYLNIIKASPAYAGWWDPLIEGFYRADVFDNPDGTVQPHTHPATIAAVIADNANEDYSAYAQAIRCPALLVRAPGPYGLASAPPIVSAEQARLTCATLPDCTYVEVPGNHMTMLYAAGAEQTVAAILSFVFG